MRTSLPLAAALALGGLAGLTIGVALPHAQAQAGIGPSPGVDLGQRAQLLDLTQRMTSLEGQVRLLEQQRLADKTTTFYSTPPSYGTPPPAFRPSQPPSDGPSMPHVRPPAYIWPAVR